MKNPTFMEELKKARNELVNEVRKELLGPGSEFNIPDAENELITDMPEIRYSIGVLFPQDEQYKADSDDSSKVEEGIKTDDNLDLDIQETEPDTANGGTKEFKQAACNAEENSLDEQIALSSQNLPSSMGFTYFIKGQSNPVKCDVSFGMYRKPKVDECMVPFFPEYDNYHLPIQVEQYIEYDEKQSVLKMKIPMKRVDVFRIFNTDQIEDLYLRDRMFLLCNQFSSTGYKRIPYRSSLVLNFEQDEFMTEQQIEDYPVKIVCLRKPIKDNITSVTIMMVNINKGIYKGINSIFQPKMSINTTCNDKFQFMEYNTIFHSQETDEEEKSLQLLYRSKKIYGTGHGTSVIWNIDERGKGIIENEFFPVEEIPQIDFDADVTVDKQGLSMKYLSDLNLIDFSAKTIAMKTLLDSYEAWINEIECSCNNPDIIRKELCPKAKEHIENCRKSLCRMRKGLTILQGNEHARNSFLLANRSMFMQRVHLKLQAKDKYPGDENLQQLLLDLNYFDEPDDYFWRPFQLAFLLMSIESVVDETCSERDIVDLIWFPTGGGKTEAYLGLTAFTIFYRRFAYENSGGTTVIMRYTLRLLAAQQFVRAATLICACEFIRKQYNKKSKFNYPTYNLGNEAMTIGLWIGSDHTPNKNTGRNSAKENLDKLKNTSGGELRYRKDRHNKFQVLKCPWCGTKLVKDTMLDKKGEIGDWGYRMKNNTAFRMFCPQEGCSFELDLPIQIVDEELYKNPPTLLFGTVDKFAMLPWKNEVGSFFATDSSNRTPELIIQDELHLISGPLGTMVGLYETVIDALCSHKGTKPKIIASTATIRRAKEQCSVLFNREVSQFPAPGIDANDSYFAREADLSKKHGRLYVGLMPSGKTKAMMEVRSMAAILGRTNMLNVEDRVKDKFWTLAVYFNSLKDLGKCSTLVDDDVKDFIKRTAYRLGLGRGRLIGSASELTSRVSTSELNETLEKLERLEYSNENITNNKYAINTLLATNMISVGVDVARLNVMLLVGQPKLTSEYIQASSRIGRTFPGVAFTLYDGSKSRDRSHYEQFKAYHESFYKYVEPTGATPFSEPARERALHAAAIAFMRHMYGLPQEADAAMFDKDYFSRQMQEIINFVTDRVNTINMRSDFPLENETDKIVDELQQFFDDWHLKVQLSENKNLCYGEKFMVKAPTTDEKRLMKAYGSGSSDAAIETLTSMRNVDGSCRSSILVWED